MLKKLPVDLSTFSLMRTGGYVYVDKTEHIYQMITGARRYFLSRPRRFGKSLLVSTLKEALQGNKELFEGLWIAGSDYQWAKHAVVHLDFSQLSSQNTQSFLVDLIDTLATSAHQHGITIDTSSGQASLIFRRLLNALHQKYGRVAILVDEYDKPILYNLHNLDRAEKIRSLIQEFFSIIKANDAIVDFAFITGVSSFAKAGLFSGINNLQIMSLDEQYAAICGYTDEEVDQCFGEHIQEWADKDEVSYADIRKKIKDWYNGYHFGEHVTAVYNPFSLTNALSRKKFINFWFESGTPTFLIELLKKQRDVFDLENLEASGSLLSTFDVDSIPLTALMFQSGYLTITGYDADSQTYMLNLPNEEVRVSLQKYLLEAFASINSANAEQMSLQLRRALNTQDISEVVQILTRFFAHIPYQLHVKEEKFYHALLQMICITAGMKVISEYSTSHGRIDLVIDLPKIIYVVEIKFNSSAQNALTQIEERRYHEQFMNRSKPVVLLGLNFKRTSRNFEIDYAVKAAKE